ncbi:hypothetical protein EDB83DRAFT_2637952 [Lactarius deliciosus]|nr:hypothetical protein EDB83DRAFT_2637952 [Lactarius deliciosus]
MEAKEIEVAKSSVRRSFLDRVTPRQYMYKYRIHVEYGFPILNLAAPAGAANGLFSRLLPDDTVGCNGGQLFEERRLEVRVRESRSSGAATGRRTVKFAMLKDMLVDLDSSTSKLVELDAIATALFDPAIFKAHRGPRAANAPALRAPPDALKWQARRRHHWGIWHVTVVPK